MYTDIKCSYALRYTREAVTFETTARFARYSASVQCFQLTFFTDLKSRYNFSVRETRHFPELCHEI